MRNTTCCSISGTTTFRLASHKTIDKKGTNLQNLEKSLRRIYIPDEGKIFVQVDQSGAEALIVAYLCRAGNFRDLFLHNIKPHVFVGQHLFKDIWQQKINAGKLDIKCDISQLCNTPIPKLKESPFWKEVDTLIKSSDSWPAKERYYYISKQVCHSSNYGIGPNMFSLNTLEKSKGKIVISKQQAQTYLTFYHSLFPEIKEWHEAVRNQIEQTGYLYNLFGFPRYFHKNGRYDDALLKEAFAFVPQSTVGTITNIAVTELQNFIEVSQLDWDILAQTHDSYLVQCPINEVDICVKFMTEIINQELKGNDGTVFRMKSEAATGFNWSPFDPKKNPDGLKPV